MDQEFLTIMTKGETPTVQAIPLHQIERILYHADQVEVTTASGAMYCYDPDEVFTVKDFKTVRELARVGTRTYSDDQKVK